MTAATFPNLSFENPPGTGPTLLSVGVEPFALASGNSLRVVFAGITTDVIMLDTDFVDITAATAAEVAALLALRITDLGTADDAGQVRLTSLLTGEDVSLQVASGSANDELLFSTIAVTGETYDGGAPDGWAVIADVDNGFEWADWDDENSRPEEIFHLDGWLVPIPVPTSVFDDAIFDVAFIPTPQERFNSWVPGPGPWGDLGPNIGFLESTPLEAVTFGQGTTFEDYESAWGLPTYFEFVPANLLDGINPEDMETGWNQGAAAVGADTTFADGTKTAEDFENVVPQWYVIQITSSAAGEWKIFINGITHLFVAGGGDGTVDIATGLNDALAASVVANSGQLLAVITVWPVKHLDLAISIQPPSGGAADQVLAVEHPLLVEEWIGQDTNPDFD